MKKYKRLKMDAKRVMGEIFEYIRLGDYRRVISNLELIDASIPLLDRAKMAISVLKKLDEKNPKLQRLQMIKLYRYYHYELIKMGWDTYYATVEKYSFDNLRAINIKPYRPDIKFFDNITAFLCYFDFVNEAIIDVSDDIVREYIERLHINDFECKLVYICTLNLIHRLCPIKINYVDSNSIFKLKSMICEYHRITPLFPVLDFGNYDRKKSDNILFVMDKAFESSDLKVSMPFIKYFKSKGCGIDVLATTDESVDDVFDTIYTDPYYMPVYKFAIIVTHVSAIGCIIKAKRIAKITIGILGHLMSSGVLDYFVVPEWDNEKNYNEKLIKLPGMAGGIPKLGKTVENSKLVDTNYIACPMTGLKLNAIMGDIFERINEKMCEKCQFFLHIGENRDNCAVQIMEELHVKPYIKNYVYTHSDILLYGKIIASADVIIMPFPYTGYVSISGIFGYAKPIVVLYDNTRFSTMSAGEILKLLGMPELVTYSIKDYVDLVHRVLTDLEFKEQISNKMKQIDYDAIVEDHNLMIEKKFGEAFEKIFGEKFR